MSPPDVPAEAARLLALARARQASDLHLEPLGAGYEARLRIDGILMPETVYPPDVGRALVTRMMVLARLLTYRTDVPQEGRFTLEDNQTELRLSIMPTAKGLRAAVRFPTDAAALANLADLSLPPSARAGIAGFLTAPAGLLVITGPAGSGKTTLCYAILTELLRLYPGQSIVTLEDPVERHLDGITQIEVTPFGQLTYDRALRSMLRQDPQVLMLGEVRDPETAALAAQAALSGHRMLATLHAADSAGAIRRLLDLGVAPHALASALIGALAIRLVRRKGTGGYSGRLPVTEFAMMTPPLRAAILNSADLADLREALKADPHHLSLSETAQALIAQNLTDTEEVARVLGTVGGTAGAPPPGSTS